METRRIPFHFWQRGPGRALRPTPLARLLALYFLSCPSSRLSGVYYIPIPLAGHELGFADGLILELLPKLSEVGFAEYDIENDLVFVPEMFGYYFQEDDPSNLHSRKVITDLLEFSPHPFVESFFALHPTLRPQETSGPEKSARESISKAQRWRILQRDRHRCTYCGATAKEATLHIDHILAVSLGGRSTDENLTVACAPCNLSKSAKRLLGAR